MAAEQDCQLQDKHDFKQETAEITADEDDDGYFNDFEHHVGSERVSSGDWTERLKSFDKSGSGNIRKSTEEFLKMKRDEFWDTHKESIEETRMINEAAEYHEQLKFMRQLEQQQHKQTQIQLQQQQLLAQQHTFKRTQQQQQQQQQQQSPPPPPPQPTTQQLQSLLLQIQQTINQFQVEYAQKTQIIQQNFQPHVINITTQLNKAMQCGDNDSIQQLTLQQQNMQQQFEAQIRLLQQHYSIQTQQLQANQLNVKNALQQIFIQQEAMRNCKMQQMYIPEYVPNNIYTIQENEAQHSRPHIVDENVHSMDNKSDNDDILHGEMPRNNSNGNLSYKPQVTSQSISSNQSQSKSPIANIMSPSISPMKLPSHNSHSSISSPPVPVTVQNTHKIINKSWSNNAIQSPITVPIPTTRSLPNSPLVGVQSLAEISRVSLTPEFKAKRRKTTQKAGAANRSLPNTPFTRPNKVNKVPVLGHGALLTPLILSQTLQKPASECKNKASDEVFTESKDDESQSHSVTVSNCKKPEESDSSSSDTEEEDAKSEYTQSTMDRSRRDSNNSLYSYSSMSTVFTGVNDGMLLANNSVYLSKMTSTEQYNKMEVVNDIKSLWLQVFSTPVLFTLVTTICICWLSAYDADDNKLAAFLLCIVIFNMCAHLMIKGMTSTLSSVCDELYNANCKPLVGIQLQNMMGFSVCVTMPMAIGLMQLFSYFISNIYSNQAVIRHMNVGINYLIFAVPALTMFYVFQRYLQGSHVLHVNGYVACCLIGAIVMELGLLIICQCVPFFRSLVSNHNIILIALIAAYWMLFILFTICINVYKLHSETFIFPISAGQIFSVKKWYKYMNTGTYRSLLLFCNYWYFDFMILMAGFKSLPQLIAFGILCNIYHLICAVISASEFVAKSLIFRGLLHSSTEYARDAWKYTIFFSFFLSVIIGGLFFLLRENISLHIFSIFDAEIQSLINDSWLYLYILIILNGIKYGLVGGAEAMAYIKLVSCMNLFSFYIVTIPVYVWISNIYCHDENDTLHAIYCSILLGVGLNILCLLIFRVFINWNRELQSFTLRAHNQAQNMQQSVEAVHIQLQHYTKSAVANFGVQCGINTNKYYHKSSCKHQHHKKHKHCHKHHHHHRKKRRNKKKKHAPLAKIPLHSTMTGTTTNSSNNSNFGRINVQPLGRQKTNETNIPIMSSTDMDPSANNMCLHCSLDSRYCRHNKGFSYGEDESNNPNKLIYDKYYLKTDSVRDIKQFKSQMRRRTLWEDLFDALKQYCCCCLFEGCCCWCDENNCCEEWWYYCCGCCCSDSYLNDDYQTAQTANLTYKTYASRSQNATGSSIANTPYSHYHIDLNNNSKYKIIYEESQPVPQPQKQQAIKLEIHNDDVANINNKKNMNHKQNDLKHSLIAHNSFGGVSSQYDQNQFNQKHSQ